MKIATWNVNSIKARLDHAVKWLGDEKPDILMMQELKGLEFPADAFTSAGYQVNFVPQKTYNGVAIVSREPAPVIFDRLPGHEGDEQARYLEVEYQGVRLINIYAPSGNPGRFPRSGRGGRRRRVPVRRPRSKRKRKQTRAVRR